MSPDFCSCTLLRGSVPDESSFGPPRYSFEGVPPQPNCLLAVVPEQTLVRDVIADRWCYIGASTGTRRPRPRRLPPTLCTRNHIPPTSCSKTPRGLLAPLGVPGLFVQVMCVHPALPRPPPTPPCPPLPSVTPPPIT